MFKSIKGGDREKMTGNVSRSLRYHDKKEEYPEWYKNRQEIAKISHLKIKKKVNKRCVDCGELITPRSTRCGSCGTKHTRKNKKWSSYPENIENDRKI